VSIESLTQRIIREDQGVHEARVVEPAGEAWRVELADSGRITSCELVQTGPFPLDVAPGDRVLALVADSGRGYILGRLGRPRESVTLSVESLAVEAKDAVVLRTRHSSMRLSADGDLELRATRVLSRASRLQRFLAPLLRLN
jgi:hypothetical protein